jgi:hypothetical protein
MINVRLTTGDPSLYNTTVTLSPASGSYDIILHKIFKVEVTVMLQAAIEYFQSKSRSCSKSRSTQSHGHQSRDHVHVIFTIIIMVASAAQLKNVRGSANRAAEAVQIR